MDPTASTAATAANEVEEQSRRTQSGFRLFPVIPFVPGHVILPLVSVKVLYTVQPFPFTHPLLPHPLTCPPISLTHPLSAPPRVLLCSAGSLSATHAKQRATPQGATLRQRPSIAVPLPLRLLERLHPPDHRRRVRQLWIQLAARPDRRRVRAEAERGGGEEGAEAQEGATAPGAEATAARPLDPSTQAHGARAQGGLPAAPAAAAGCSVILLPLLLSLPHPPPPPHHPSSGSSPSTPTAATSSRPPRATSANATTPTPATPATSTGSTP